MDQQAQGEQPHRPETSVNTTHPCLNQVDRFRWTTAGGGAPGHGEALDLDTSSQDSVNVPYKSAYDLDVFTVSTWFRAAGPSVSPYRLLAKRSCCQINFEILLEYSGSTCNQLITVFTRGGINAPRLIPCGTLNDGNWHHVAMVCGQNFALHVDGVLQNQTPGSCTVDNPANDIRLGQGFNGQIDEVRIENVARTQAEISAYYRNTVANYNAAASNRWNVGATGNLFAACLRSIGANTLQDWTPDSTCTTATGDAAAPNAWWNAIPDTSASAASKIAHTTAIGNGTANLRYCLKTTTTQQAGSYDVPMVFEVLAP